MSKFLFCFLFTFLTVTSFGQTKNNTKEKFDCSFTNAEWKEKLTPEQYNILINSGTERAFTGEFWDNKRKGTYSCAGCGQKLFLSNTKFKSGSGWPSFYSPIKNSVSVTPEKDGFYTRDEVICSNCGGHLGHVFSDGPQPTGLRYCINSGSLNFEEKSTDDTQQKFYISDK